MAKTNSNPPKPQTGGNSNGGNVSKPVQPTIKLPRWLLFIPLFLIIFLLPSHHSLASTAALYMWANDGKVSGRTSGNVQMRNGVSRGMGFAAKVLNQFTSNAKAIFSFFQSNWNNLTDAQRLTWNGYTTFTSNRFAVLKKVTGKTAYSQLNINIANVQGTAIVDAPKLGNPAYTALSSLTADASAGTISLAYTTNSDGATTLFFATKPLNAGVYKPSNSSFRMFAEGDTSAAGPIALGTDYVSRFGVITSKAGSKIFLRVVVIDALTGHASIASQIDTYIVP